jgi:hypothetical protein
MGASGLSIEVRALVRGHPIDATRSEEAAISAPTDKSTRPTTQMFH